MASEAESVLLLFLWLQAPLRSTCSRHPTEMACALDECESRLEGHLYKLPQNVHQRMMARRVAVPRKYERTNLPLHFPSLYRYSTLLL